MRSALRCCRNVFSGYNVQLDLADRIDIADNVTLSMNVVLTTHTDLRRIPLAGRYPPRRAPIWIAKDVYVGTGAIVFVGLRIGLHAVVAATAVVRRDVAPYPVGDGVPAHMLKTMEPVSLA